MILEPKGSLEVTPCLWPAVEEVQGGRHLWQDQADSTLGAAVTLERSMVAQITVLLPEKLDGKPHSHGHCSSSGEDTGHSLQLKITSSPKLSRYPHSAVGESGLMIVHAVA